MAIIAFSQTGATPFQRLLGHNGEVLKKWAALEDCFLSSGTFAPELKEEVRRALAFANGCEYCKAKGAPAERGEDLKTLTAVRAADMSGRKTHMGPDEYAGLREVFSDGEISELLAYICFITACQRYGALLDLGPACEI